MADRYELASAIFGTKRAETDASSLSSAIITGTAVEDSEEGVVKIVPDGNVIAPDGEDNTIILPTSPNVKEGDNVIIISTGGTATTPIVTGASGSGDRIVSELNTLLTDVEGIETLIRETTDGVLVAKVGQTVGALVNADGSFDVVEITGWNDGVPTVGNALSSFGESSAYIGAFQETQGSYPYVDGSLSILPLIGTSGTIRFAPIKIETRINSGDLSFAKSTVTFHRRAEIVNNYGSVTMGQQGTMIVPAEYPWIWVTPTNSRSMLVGSKFYVGSYSPNGTHTGVELTPDGDINADGDITANSFTGSVDWSNIVIGITEQPQDTNASAGTYASFHVGTNDAGATYQWQWYVNGGWASCPHQGNDSPTLYVMCSTAELAAQYRCVVAFSDGTTETSDAASIDSTAAFRIVKQPESMFVASTSDQFSFTVEVDDSAATYRWQTCSDGSTWSNSSLLNNATKTLGPVNATAGRQTYLYRCRIQFSDRTSGDYVYSDVVTVTQNADAQAQIQSVQSKSESI